VQKSGINAPEKSINTFQYLKKVYFLAIVRFSESIFLGFLTSWWIASTRESDFIVLTTLKKCKLNLPIIKNKKYTFAPNTKTLNITFFYNYYRK